MMQKLGSELSRQRFQEKHCRRSWIIRCDYGCGCCEINTFIRGRKSVLVQQNGRNNWAKMFERRKRLVASSSYQTVHDFNSLSI